jgi:Tol biopolymer transport system component
MYKIVLFVACIAFLLLSGCRQQDQGETENNRTGPVYTGFRKPQQVTIQGYDNKKDAMEPFLSRDGRYLFFNNRNDFRGNTNLHYAERINDIIFKYSGELKKVNTPVLETTSSLDSHGNFYFCSTRNYSKTLSTLYYGYFHKDGKISDIKLVRGVSLQYKGSILFAEISSDGKTLFLADGEFKNFLPQSAGITIAEKDSDRFRRLPESNALMININTRKLEYAPAISSDLLELFFTRAEPATSDSKPEIFRATRSSTKEPFGLPERIAAITGFAEAPALSPDGRSLYYHKFVGDRFVIYRITR